MVGIRPLADTPHDSGQFTGAEWPSDVLGQRVAVQGVGPLLHLAHQGAAGHALVVQAVGRSAQRLERRAVAALNVGGLRCLLCLATGQGSQGGQVAQQLAQCPQSPRNDAGQVIGVQGAATQQARKAGVSPQLLRQAAP